jgi:nitrite reductase/ring-hydroxylating ferredoxin subunit
VDRNNAVPYTKVNFTVLVSSSNLIHVGGYDYFTGGISGILIYRLDMNTFYAYDRACPYDWEDNGYVIFDPASMQLKCETCGSTFNILNGYPMENSKAASPLRLYQTNFIDDITLHVYN